MAQSVNEIKMRLQAACEEELPELIRMYGEDGRAGVRKLAAAAEKVQSFIAGKTVRKVIVVPGRLVNIVVA